MESYSLWKQGLVVLSQWNSADQVFPRLAGLDTMWAGNSFQGNFVAPNPFFYTKTIQRFQTGYERVVDKTTGKFVNGQNGVLDQYQDIYVTWPDVSSEKVTAFNNALSKLNDQARGSLDLAVSLAEAPTTVKMLTLTRRFVDGMLHMRRHAFKKLSNFTKEKRFRQRKRELERWQNHMVATMPVAIRQHYRPLKVNRSLVGRVSAGAANGWLEFTYGWSPLVSDIYGLAEQTVGRVHRTFQRHTVRVRIPVSRTVQDTIYGFPLTVKTDGFTSVQMGAFVDGGFDSDLARFTSLNPAIVVWELIPYSFVFDWFLNIGGYMKDLETSMLSQTRFQWGYTSRLTVLDTTATVRGSYVTGNSVVSRNSVGSRIQREFVREKMSSWPVPNFPSVRTSLGSTQLLSAASLLRQLIR